MAVEEDAMVRSSSEELPTPSAEAKGLLQSMRALADKARRQPDGKARALLAWPRTNLCAGIGGTGGGRDAKAWADRRVIIFTEYGDTKRYLQELLGEAIADTDHRGDERVLVLHGGMGDEARDQVQRAFNAKPSEHPVRILLATDAAREGVNLQAHCADLFPLRRAVEPVAPRATQRPHRSLLQESDEVRCHYFVYAARKEDMVLEALVRKIRDIAASARLGGGGADGRDGADAGAGITERTAAKVEAIGADARSKTAEEELESQTASSRSSSKRSIVRASGSSARDVRWG